MKKTTKLIRPVINSIFINNKLYVRGYNDNFIRVKQKLPDFIEDIEELETYDIDFKPKAKPKVGKPNF